MPRQRRYETISENHRQAIERQIGLLRSGLLQASRALTPFKPHYEAINDLNGYLERALNLLAGREPDHKWPHQSLMQGLCDPTLNDATATENDTRPSQKKTKSLE